MNIKRIEIISELLTEQMNHWLLFPLVLTFMGVVRAMAGIGEPSLSMWALCSLIPIAFFIFRCKLRNLILFLLAHLGTVVLVFALSGQSILVRIACTVCVIGYMLQSLVLRLKKNTVYSDGIYMAFGVGLSAGAALLQQYQGMYGWGNYYFFPLIVCIALYFVIYYMDHYLVFLEMNKSSAGFLPASEMFHSGMGLVLGYTMLGVAALILSTQSEWLAGILRPIKNLLLRFIRFLLSRDKTSQEEIVPIGESAPMNNMGDMGLPEGGEPFWLWEVLEALVMIGLAVAMVVGIGILLWKLIKLIRKYMTFRYREEAMETGEAFDFREKCEIEKGSEKRIQDLFSVLSPKERIRKLYKKRLPAAAARMNTENKVHEDMGLLTAREWESKLALKGMADIYEQARYSNRELTSAHVKKMKESMKDI